MKLKDSVKGSASLYAKEQGPCIGAGVRYSSEVWGVESSLCYAYMTATVSENSTSFKYNQNAVPIDALVLNTAILWKPEVDIAIKLGLPFLYHKGNYEAPDGATIDNPESFSFGYKLGAEWGYENFNFEMAIGEFQNLPSNFWSFNLSYFFR